MTAAPSPDSIGSNPTPFSGFGRGAVRRVVLVPDLDDELTVVLSQVEELLLTVAAAALDALNDDHGHEVQPLMLPAPLAGRVALDALNRVQAVVEPTQTRDGRPAPGGGRLLGADGRYEHRPLRLVVLDPADLDVLSAAAATMGHELATGPRSVLWEVLHAGAEAAAGAGLYGLTETTVIPHALVEALARAHDLLDLAVTDDTRTVATRVADLDHGDIVLTPSEDAAYERLRDRFNTTWTGADPLATWTY